MKLDNLKTRTKIMILVIFASLVAIGLGGGGSYLLQNSLDEFESQKAHSIRPVIWLTGVKAQTWSGQALLLEEVLSTNPARVSQLDKEIDAARAAAGEFIANYDKTITSGPVEDAAKAKAFAARTKYIADNQKARQLARLATTPQTQAEFIKYYEQTLDASFREYIADLEDLIQIVTKANIAEQKAFNDTSANMITMFITIVITATIILFVLGMFLARNITTVLGEVTDMALNMSENDLTHKLSPKTTTRLDEFGDMGRALDTMQTNLNTSMKSIGSIAENIAASSEELTANADQTAKASTDVANSTTVILSSTEEAGRQLEKALELVKNSEVSLQDMADSANTVAGTAVNTSGTAQEGYQSVETAVISINSVGKSTSRVTEAVTELKDSSTKIGEIVEMITGIASQTNLLALNAAIEAARAGEHGRGFAVVAEEVRKLAEESGGAAEQIGELIRKNTVSIEHTVSLMDEQRSLVDQGVEKVNLSGEAFAKILSMIENLTSQIQNISAGVEETAAGSKQIVTANEAVAAAAGKTMEEVTNVSAAAQEQAASTEEIASSSQVLAQMAEELNIISSKFKL